jgi:outer membrane beta-barrel protein
MKKINLASAFLLSLAAAGICLSTSWAQAADSAATPAPAQPSAQASGQPASQDDGAERVNTESIKEKYWARGDESEIGVVQNRLYSKEHRFEFSLLAGIDITDPMLSVYTLGGRFGYHFSEYFSWHLIAWKAYSGPSGTQEDLLSNKSPGQIGDALNTNSPDWFVGTEAQWSLLYGKLSVVGKAIIHYDLHFMAGIGGMKTDSGLDFAQHVGVGQQFFLGKSTFLNVDYRLVHYSENIVQQVVPTELGQSVGTRQNFSNVITVGVGFMFGGGSK